MIMFQPKNIFINLNNKKSSNDQENSSNSSEIQNDNQLSYEEDVDKLYELINDSQINIQNCSQINNQNNNQVEVYNNFDYTENSSAILPSNEINTNNFKNFVVEEKNYDTKFSNQLIQSNKLIKTIDLNLNDSDICQIIKDKNSEHEFILNDLNDFHELNQKEFINPNTELEKRIPRPPNAFMIFGQQNRKLLANQFPQYTNKQISKILGDEWRKMKLDEKSHFHRLADEAYTKHMQKYPGYYYSPLEARQRKADRKKKFFQKINSRRNYVKQQQNCSLTSDNIELPKIINKNSIQLSQLINFSNSNIFEKNDNAQTNEAYDTFKNKNSKLFDKMIVSKTNSPILSQMDDNSKNQEFYQNNLINSVNSNEELNQVIPTSNFPITNYPLKRMYNFELHPNFPISNNQNFNQIQNTTNQITPNNGIFCSHGMIHNNMVQNYLNFKNFNNSSNEINFVNSSNDVHQKNRKETFPFNPLSYHYHHHHNINNYTTPTIYHVSNKDPNLNSTMSEVNANNFLTANNFNQQKFLPNQEQIIIQKPINQPKNDINLLSSFLPPMDNPSNYITPVGPAYSFEEMMIETEKQNFTKIQNQQSALNQVNKVCVKLDS